MLHIHSRIPTRFQNSNYEIKMSDFILAKSSIIPVPQDSLHIPTYASLKGTNKPTTEASHQNLDEEISDSDTDNNDENEEPDARTVENEDADEANEEEDSDNPSNDENYIVNQENEEQVNEEPMRIRPQRAAKNKAYRTRLWLRDQETEDEIYDGDHVNMDQIDGNIITPDLTPENSPEKAPEVLDDDQEANSSSDSSVFQANSNTTNLEWDNYASSPDLSGCRWTDSSDYKETSASPILTQYFFNRKYPSRIPFRSRSRFKSFSENDVNQTENQEEIALTPEDHGCFSTRVFFRRFRQTLGLSSRSSPDLTVNSNVQETSL